MFSETASWSSYLYGRLKNLVDAEATYVSVRQQSAKDNLPKKVLSVADSISFAVKGATAAVILGYGAPLPITALVTLSLFPPNTFSYLATKINRLSNRFNKWLSSDEQIDDSDLYKVSYKHHFPYENSSINLGSCLPSIETLETVQYVVTKGLTIYQKLLPVNWLQTVAVEAVEQPLRWYNSGKLPDYYTKQAIGDWIWTLSGTFGELLQNSKLLSNLNYNQSYQILNAGSNFVPMVNSRHLIMNSFNPYLPVINIQRITSLALPLVTTFLLGARNNLQQNIIPLALSLFFSQFEQGSAGSTCNQGGLLDSLLCSTYAGVCPGTSVYSYVDVYQHTHCMDDWGNPAPDYNVCFCRLEVRNVSGAAWLYNGRSMKLECGVSRGAGTYCFDPVYTCLHDHCGEFGFGGGGYFCSVSSACDYQAVVDTTVADLVKNTVYGTISVCDKRWHVCTTYATAPTEDCSTITPYEYAYLSNIVYGNGSLSGLNGNFPGWRNMTPSSSPSSDFYGQLFNKSGTYVFAIRGTVLSLRYTMTSLENVLADISLALGSDVTGFLSIYFLQAVNYLNTSLKGTNTKCLTFTGHSLGAALAEVLAGAYKSSSVGFENPGAASYMRGQNIPTGNVTAYQASPNLIDTLDTSAISTIYRVFPPYTYPSSMTQAINVILANVVSGILPMGPLLGSNLGLQLIPEYIEYTLQQHDMSNILTQFNPVTGQPYVFSKQTNGWATFSVQEGFSGFFLRYGLNSYYWLNKKTALAGSLLGGLGNSVNTAYNFVITGSDNHDDLLWGAGDYDDVLDGKSGNDQYWAFSGMNNITDESGNDVYHFFTTNMQGITTINDGDGLGSITLDNYGNCNIQSRSIALVNVSGAGNVVFAFYPNDPNTGCQPDSTFSSQLFGILNNYHNNDVFFLQLSGQNLMITLNSIATNPSKRGTIIISHFQDGNIGISLNGVDRTISNAKIYYVSVTAGEVLKCDFNHDSYLFGLIGSSTYMNYDNNPYSCVMVGNSDAANKFIFTPGYVKGQKVKALPSVTTGISTIQGYKSGDLIDVSAFNSSSASFQQDVVVGQVTMTLSNGVTILLPSVYNNISYTVDGKNNLTFVPTIVSPFNTTTITPTVTVSPTLSPTSSYTTTISSTPTPTSTNTDTTTSSSIPIHAESIQTLTPTPSTTDTNTDTAMISPTPTTTSTNTDTTTSTISTDNLINLKSGLAASWPFNGNANDESGNHFDGIIIGATLTSDRFGRINSAYSFDGISNYIQIGNSVPSLLQIQNSISFSAWIYVSYLPQSTWYYIVGCQNDLITGGTGIAIYDNFIHFQVADGTWRLTTTTNGLVTINQWGHIVATRNANEIGEIYYNGVPQSTISTPWSGTITYTGAIYTIGKQNGVGRYFKGSIDDVQIYNRSLTQAEVIALYTNSNPYTTKSSTTPSTTFTQSNTPTPTNSKALTVMNTTSNVITINLQSGVPINVPIDLTQLAGTNNISNLIIKYPPELTQSGLKLYLKLFGNYIQEQTIAPYQLLATNISQVDVLSSGIQLQNETLKTTFLVDGQLEWQYLINGGTSYTPAVASDGTIYVSSYEYLYAIYPNSTLKWQYLIGGSCCIDSLSPVIANDNTIYVGSIWGLYSIYPNGTLRWQYSDTGLYFTCKPTIAYDGTVYAGTKTSDDDCLYAVYYNGTLKWKYCTNNSLLGITSAPFIANDGTVYLGSGDSYLYAIYPNGSLKWKYQTGSPILFSSPAIACDGTIYVGSDVLYSIHSNGTLRRKYQEIGSVQSSIVIALDGTIYVGTIGALYAIYPNGNLKWRFDMVIQSSMPAIGRDDTIYVGSMDNYLYAVYPNGNLKWRYKTDSFILASPTITNNNIIYVSSNYYLYAIGIKTFSNVQQIQFCQNDLSTGIATTTQLQLFDMRYLTLIGTPSINGSLKLETIVNQTQPIYFYMYLTIIKNNNSTLAETNPITLTPTTTFTHSNTPSPINSKALTVMNATNNVMIINLQSGVPINIPIDLTQLAGITDISNMIINYPMDLAQSGLKLYPRLLRNYTQGQTIPGYQLLAQSQNNVNVLSIGIQYKNINIVFWGDGLLKWKYPTKTGNFIGTSPAIGSDGVVYIGADDGNIYAIYPNGSLKWKYLTNNRVSSSPAIGSDGTVYVGSFDYNLYAIYPNGSLKWKYLTGGIVQSSPAIGSNGTVYIGSYDGSLYAIYPNGSLMWEHLNSGSYSSPAIGSDGTVYADGGFNLCAIHPNGSLKWNYLIESAIISSPTIGSDGTVYVGSVMGNLYAIYPNGSLKWKYLTGGIEQSSPAIGSDGTVYVGSFDSSLYAIYPDGSLKWKYLTDDGSNFLFPTIGSDGTVYLGCGDSNLYAIYPNGNLKWKYLTNGDVYSFPTIGSDGTVYVGSDDGNLYAISIKSYSNEDPWPQFLQNNLHTGLQPNSPQLQLFDMRYLTLGGIPNINGSLKLETIVNQTQPIYMHLTVIKTNNSVLTEAGSVTPTPTNTFTNSMLTETDSVTPTPTTTSTHSNTPAATSPSIPTIVTSPPSTESSKDNTKLYLDIGLAVGGCIIGTIATSTLILYCYKKRQKERVLPSSLQPQNQTATIGIPMSDRDFNPGAEVTTTNSDLTRRGNTRFFSTLRGTSQAYAPTTEPSQSNPGCNYITGGNVS